jgi:hypothetical protein
MELPGFILVAMSFSQVYTQERRKWFEIKKEFLNTKAKKGTKEKHKNTH